MRKYSEDHEWVEVNGNIGTVGITDYAQGALGDIVYVELPEVDTVLNQGDEAAVVESVKAASEVYTPVSGTVTAVNEKLTDEPAMVNAAPEDAAWFYKIELSDLSELDGLMDEDAYQSFVDELA